MASLLGGLSFAKSQDEYKEEQERVVVIASLLCLLNPVHVILWDLLWGVHLRSSFLRRFLVIKNHFEIMGHEGSALVLLCDWA